jgi:hypothetical protein
MLRHLHGKQRIANEVLKRLFPLADQTQQGAMVAGAEICPCLVFEKRFVRTGEEADCFKEILPLRRRTLGASRFWKKSLKIRQAFPHVSVAGRGRDERLRLQGIVGARLLQGQGNGGCGARDPSGPGRGKTSFGDDAWQLSRRALQLRAGLDNWPVGDKRRISMIGVAELLDLEV